MRMLSRLAPLVGLLLVGAWGQQTCVEPPANAYTVIAGGQSNMQGRADTVSWMQQGASNCYMYDDDQDCFVAVSHLNDWKEPTYAGGRLSPIFGFCDEMYQNTRRPTIIIPAAAGGSCMDRWIRPGRGLFDTSFIWANAAYRPGDTLLGFIFHQGECDGGTSYGFSYRDSLSIMVNKFRDTLHSPASLWSGALVADSIPFVAGQIMFSSVWRDSINAHVDTIERYLPRTEGVLRKDLTSYDGGTHFDNVSTQALGKRYAKALLPLAGKSWGLGEGGAGISHPYVGDACDSTIWVPGDIPDFRRALDTLKPNVTGFGHTCVVIDSGIRLNTNGNTVNYQSTDYAPGASDSITIMARKGHAHQATANKGVRFQIKKTAGESMMTWVTDKTRWVDLAWWTDTATTFGWFKGQVGTNADYNKFIGCWFVVRDTTTGTSTGGLLNVYDSAYFIGSHFYANKTTCNGCLGTYFGSALVVNSSSYGASYPWVSFRASGATGYNSWGWSSNLTASDGFNGLGRPFTRFSNSSVRLVEVNFDQNISSTSIRNPGLDTLRLASPVTGLVRDSLSILFRRGSAAAPWIPATDVQGDAYGWAVTGARSDSGAIGWDFNSSPYVAPPTPSPSTRRHPILRFMHGLGMRLGF